VKQIQSFQLMADFDEICYFDITDAPNYLPVCKKESVIIKGAGDLTL